MYHTNQDRRGTAYTVSVDAREGTTTGISAYDRSLTMRRLADPSSVAVDFTPSAGPPVCCRCARGTAGCCAGPGTPRPRSTCARLAGLTPAGVLCEIVSEKDVEGMARLDELELFVAVHELALISIGWIHRVPTA